MLVREEVERFEALDREPGRGADDLGAAPARRRGRAAGARRERAALGVAVGGRPRARGGDGAGRRVAPAARADGAPQGRAAPTTTCTRCASCSGSTPRPRGGDPGRRGHEPRRAPPAGVIRSGWARAAARWRWRRRAGWPSGSTGEVELVTITTAGDRGSHGRQVALRQGDRGGAAGRGRSTSRCTRPRTCRASCPPGSRSWACRSAPTPRRALRRGVARRACATGAVVGTASVRRRAQLLAAARRTSRCASCAATSTRACGGSPTATSTRSCSPAPGLERLGRGGEGEPLPELVPAPGQGCLALEARSDDDAAAAAAAGADRPRRADRADRRARAGHRAGRHLQHADRRARRRSATASLRLTAFVGLPDGSHWIRDELDGDLRRPGGARPRGGGAAGGRRRARAAGPGGTARRTRRTLTR